MVPGKRHKVLLAIFLLGLVALGLDRVFLRPQGGTVAAADPWELLMAPDSPEDGVPAGSAAQGPSLAQRLDRLWSDRGQDATEMRDPFGLPVSWRGGSADGSAAASDAAAEFARTHPLVAVVVDGHRSHALVGEHCLKLGQAIDNFTLVSVGPKSAVFERGNDRVVLELANQ